MEYKPQKQGEDVDIKQAHEMHCGGMTIKEIAEHFGLSYSTVKNRLYRFRGKTGTETPYPVGSPTRKPFTAPVKAAGLSLQEALNVPCTMEDLIGRTGLTRRMLEAGIEELQEDGLNLICIDGVYQVSKTVEPVQNLHTAKWDGRKLITFGVLSDTHMGSKYEQLTFLHELYDLFAQRGITVVYHAGDITEGDYIGRAGHIYERHKHGVDAQADYVAEHYPRRDGLKTYFIGGNHDATHMKNGGADILKMIARKREDMVNLGWDNAKINLTPNCILELNHPSGGSAYAMSYQIQKYIETISGGEKPSILFEGHYHKALYLFTRNIHAFEAGSIQAQSPWMRSKRLAAHVGGWIVTLELTDDGSIARIVPEFIPLYVHREDDYK